MLPVWCLRAGGRCVPAFAGVCKHWCTCRELTVSLLCAPGRGEGARCRGRNERMERKERVKEEAEGREGKSEVAMPVESQQKNSRKKETRP